jgi:hypothetical protein
VIGQPHEKSTYRHRSDAVVLVKEGKKIKPKKEMTAKILLSRIFVVTVLIVVPLYLVSLIKVFFEGGERQPDKTEKAACAIIIMPEERPAEATGDHFSHAVDTAVLLKQKQVADLLIFTGFEGYFSEGQVEEIREKVLGARAALILQHEIMFTRPMKGYEDLAVSLETYMAENDLVSATLVNNSYYMAKTVLYFKRVDNKLGHDLMFRGFPYIVPEEEKKQAKDWWYIYREALYYIYYFIFEHPGGQSGMYGSPDVL